MPFGAAEDHLLAVVRGGKADTGSSPGCRGGEEAVEVVKAVREALETVGA